MKKMPNTQVRALGRKLAQPAMRELDEEEIGNVSGAGTIVYCSGNGGYDKQIDTTD